MSLPQSIASLPLHKMSLPQSIVSLPLHIMSFPLSIVSIPNGNYRDILPLRIVSLWAYLLTACH